MPDSALRDSLIAAAGERKLVALHYLSEAPSTDERVPAVVVGHIVKVSARVVVVATQSKNETVVPLEHVQRIDLCGPPAIVAEATSPEAA